MIWSDHPAISGRMETMLEKTGLKDEQISTVYEMSMGCELKKSPFFRSARTGARLCIVSSPETEQIAL